MCHGYKAKRGANNFGWYRRTFTLPSADAGKVLWLEFDGIYRHALIWFNGHCIGWDVSGYAPIHFEVTPHANPNPANWVPIQTNTPVNGLVIFNDTNAVDSLMQFYRVKVWPSPL